MMSLIISSEVSKLIWIYPIIHFSLFSVVSSESAQYLLASKMKKTVKGVFPILFNFRRKESGPFNLGEIANVSSKSNDGTLVLNRIVKDAKNVGVGSGKIPKRAEIKLKSISNYLYKLL